MNIKTYYIILSVFFMVSSTVYSETKLRNYSGGLALYENYQLAPIISFSYETISNRGVSRTMSASFLTTRHENQSNLKLNWIPLTIGRGYYVRPIYGVRVYGIGFGSLNFISFPFDSPVFGYGARVGALKRLNSYYNLFVELNKHLINNSDEDPMVLKVGIKRVLPENKRKRVLDNERLKKRKVKRKRGILSSKLLPWKKNKD